MTEIEFVAEPPRPRADRQDAAPSGIVQYLKRRYGLEVVTRKVDGSVKVYARVAA